MTAMPAIVSSAMDETPEASPSSPSMKLIALVTPAIHKMVTIELKKPNSISPPNGKLMNSTCNRPQNTTKQATASCVMNLVLGDKSNTSSKKPSPIITTAPIIMAVWYSFEG